MLQKCVTTDNTRKQEKLVEIAIEIKQKMQEIGRSSTQQVKTATEIGIALPFRSRRQTVK